MSDIETINIEIKETDNLLRKINALDLLPNGFNIADMLRIIHTATMYSGNLYSKREELKNES